MMPLKQHENLTLFRKRHLDYDEDISSKRVRIEHMLENLDISSDQPRQKRTPRGLRNQGFVINPLATARDLLDKDPPKSKIDTYISEKLRLSFENKIHHDYAVGRWCPPIACIVLHYQRWARRLFNAFVKHYNSVNPNSAKVRPFRSYSKIIQLVESRTTFLNMDHLRQILQEQNAVEQRALRKKHKVRQDQNRVEELTEEAVASQESKYTYWDHFAKDAQDVGMEIALDAAILSSLSDEMMLD